MSSEPSQPSTDIPSRPPVGPVAGLVIVAFAVGLAGWLLIGRVPDPSAPAVTTASAPATPPGPGTTATPTPGAQPATPASTTTTTTTATTTTTIAATTPPADEKIEPGLTLTITPAKGDPAAVGDKRTARLVSLYVPAGQPPTPFTEPGAFTATFEGYIVKDVWDKVEFVVQGTGSVTLTVNGKELMNQAGPELAGKPSEKIRLDKGKNRIAVTYRSPATGDARLRLLWIGSEYGIEPVAATSFVHNVTDKPLKAAMRLRNGRELIGTMRCTKCHATDASADTGLPELAIDAPDLNEAGARLNTEWMAAWIRDPKALRPDATMPRLHGVGSDQDAADMAAYLASLGKADGAAPANDEKVVASGGHLFAKLGCSACHSGTPENPAHISLALVAKKWQPAALVRFLMQPSKHYAWIRMPTFNLKEDEARQIAAYVLAKNTADLPKKSAAGDVAKGKALVAATGCANCHKVGDAAPVAMAKLADIGKDVTKGCLATDDGSRGKAPDFAFAGSQVSALRAFLGSDRASLKRRDPAEFAERRISALHCNSCHERDGQEPRLAAISGVVDELVAQLPPEEVVQTDHGEAGGAAANNPRPLLTFTGDKLRPEWMAKFIAGHQPYRTRPWLNMRMPFFPAGAELLAQGIAMQHGMPPVTLAEPAPAKDLKADGETLTSPNGGFACSQCHGIGSAPPVAVFEAPGINLGYTPQRLQKDYFQRWMLNPLRFDPVTRMPKFAQDDGTTPLSSVLGGKAADQFEAVWQYLNDVNKKTDFPH